MSDEPPPSALGVSVLADLANTSLAARRWLQLRTMWDIATSDPRDHGRDELLQQARSLDRALVDAQAHARALASFFDRHADAVNELLASARTDGARSHLDSGVRDKLYSLGPDYAAAGASVARAFLEDSSTERDFIRDQIASLEEGTDTTSAKPMSASSSTCDMIAAWLLEDDLGCLSGSKLSCALETLDAEWAKAFGCWELPPAPGS